MNEVKRRALEEARADAAHELRAASGGLGRLAVRLRLLAAFTRVVLTLPADGPAVRESLLAGVGRDLRYALRRLRQAPAFSVFSVISLSIAIGATTAVYSLVHAVMGPPPGIRNPDTAVVVAHAPQGSLPMAALSWPDYQDLRARQDVFEHLAAWSWLRVSYAADGVSMSGIGELVTGEYFETLGVRAIRGRPLQPADDDPAAPPVANISHRAWHRMFGGREGALGQTIRVNGSDYRVVGIVDETFLGLFNGGLIRTSVWLPMSAARTEGFDSTASFDSQDRDRRWVMVQGRLAPDRTIATANAQVTVIARQLDEAFPLGEGLDARFRVPFAVGRTGWIVKPTTGRVFGVPDWLARRFALSLLAAVGLVLLVASTNLSNLSVARATRRRHELLTRRALGASRFRLVRETLSDSLILAAIGGLVSLLVARGLMHVLATELSINGAALQADPHLDLAALAWTFGAASLVLIVAGLLPALVSTRALQPGLASAGPTTAGRWRGRRYLIALQVTVSTMLVVLASAFAVQVREGVAIDTGIDLDRLALAQIDFEAQRYDEAQTRRFVSEVLARLQSRPDVEWAAVSSGLPMALRNPGAVARSGGTSMPVAFVAATPDVGRTFGLAVSRGRMFDERDAAGPPVVVLSEITAERLFGTVDAVGRTVTIERRRWVGDPDDVSRPRTLTVIGVVSDTDADVPGRRASGVAYLPFGRHFEPRLVVSVRTAGDPARLVHGVRETVVSIDPRLAVAQIGTGDALAGPDLRFQQIVGSTAALLGTFALVLALAGLYGVMVHLVSARTKEVGLRIALGATAGSIERMVIREGLGPVVLGLMAGLGLAFVLAMGVRATLRGMDLHFSIAALAPVAALFFVAGLIACYLPARRASRIDPNRALRSQ